MNKIKVVHVIQSLGYGGAEINLVDICKKIDKNKFDVFVITFWNSCTIEDSLNEIDGVHHIGLNKKNRYDFRIFFSLLRTLRLINPDIIHTHLPIAGIYTRLCSFFINSRIISTQHSVYYKKNLFHKIDRITSRYLNYKIIANSNFTKSFLVNNRYIKPDKVEVISLGVDYSKLRTNLNKTVIKKELGLQNKVILGHIGSFKVHKGHKYLIESFKRIIPKIPNAILMLIGGGPLLEEIKLKADELNLLDNIVFVGETNEIDRYLSVMDIFVMPSISESFGISILEAMYMKVPVVAFKTDAIPELIKQGDTGYLVDKYNSEMLSETIIHIIINKERNETIKRNAKQFAEEFAMEFKIKEIEQLYLSIIHNH